MIGLGLIGCGQWGINYVRNFMLIPGANILKVWDLDNQAMTSAQTINTQTAAANGMADILIDPNITGVIIATPPATHHYLAKLCLEHGKNILVEKPFTLSLRESREITRIAEEKGLIILVGHLMEYHPAYIELKKYIHRGELGQLWYTDSYRCGDGRIRSDANVLWDLAVHDIALTCSLLDDLPTQVSAFGGTYRMGIHPEVVFVTMRFASGLLSRIQASWLNPYKHRGMMINGERGAATLNELEPTNPLTISEFGGPLIIPKVEPTQPLMQMCRHFIKCLKDHGHPRTGGKDGERVQIVLESAQQSLDKRGQMIHIPGGK